MHNKELSFKEILVHSWEIFRNYFFLFIGLELVIDIPVILLSYIAPFELAAFFGLVLEPISTMAIIYAVSQVIKSQKVTFEKAFNKGVSKLFWALWTLVILTILMIGLYILLIVPAIIFGVYWMFTLPAVILHNKHGLKAMAYSKSLVKGRWWKVLGYSLGLGLLVAVINLITWAPFAKRYPELIAEYQMTPYPALDSLLMILNVIVATYFIVAFTVFFISLDHSKKAS